MRLAQCYTLPNSKEVLMPVSRLSQFLTFLGVAAQLAGMSLDAWLHANNPALAAHEGVFTLANPAHALIVGGLALGTLGVSLGLARAVSDLGRAANRRLALARAVAPVALLVGLSGLSAYSAWQTSAVEARAIAEGSHSHGGPADGLGLGVKDAGRHDHGPEVKVTMADLAKLQTQLEAARAATEKYKDVEVAKRDGYIQVTNYIPSLGAHFINPRYVFGSSRNDPSRSTGNGGKEFDPTRPEVLLYEPDGNGGWSLVGVSYLAVKQKGNETPPEGFAGGIDTWHYHSDLCFVGKDVTVAKADDCKRKNGLYQPETPWMMHAWLFKESPEGIFSHENSLLK
jgi:hypothetical protein